MKLSEKIHKLHALQQDYQKLASLVRGIETNEDAPIFDAEWYMETKLRYKQVLAHAESLKEDLGL